MSARTLAGRPRLALKIWLIGLVQFLVVAFGMEMNRRAQRPSTAPFEAEGRFVTDTIARSAGDPAELSREVARVSTTLGWTVVVRDAKGNVLAEAADKPIPPDARVARRVLPIVLADGTQGGLEYSFARRPAPSFVVPITLILLVVGIGSWLTARALTRPLAQLSEAARAFGAGSLDVRTEMTRRDELGDVGRAFNDMADRIAQLLLAERELLANVSHELRTPLARIRVALDLASEAEPTMGMESLGEIAEDLAELERIVDDVLVAARIALEDRPPQSKPGLTMRREALDTRALLERAVTKFRSAHPQRELLVEIEDAVPEIYGDAVLLRRVLDNLLDNAHKYTEDAAKPIRLDAVRDGTGVVIEVHDSGVGVAPDDVERLFEPFFRADRSRTRATGGLGLGLALARSVVDAHGGTIAFESAIGVGTVARVRLPGVDVAPDAVSRRS